MDGSRPSAMTLAGFVFVVICGGSNVVAVRLSNRELDPMWAAGSRFAIAALLLFAVARAFRAPFPRGRALAGAAVFGAFNFFAFFAFAYFALQEVPAALGGVVFGLIPLLTLVLAATQGIEKLRLRAVLGALIAIGGVAVMVGARTNADVPLINVAAMLGAAVCAAQASVVVKRSPPMHPIAMNAVAMSVGAPPLLVLSLLTGETWALPHRTTTWLTLAYVIPVGSVALFVVYLYVLNRWTASAVSYQFVMFPVVAALVGAWVADEPLSATIAIGAALVIAGTYVGALAPTTTRTEAAAEPAA